MALLLLLLLPLSTLSFLPPPAFTPSPPTSSSSSSSSLCALDEGLTSRLASITRSFQSLTERLGDPDVLSSPKLLRELMGERRKSEEIVEAFEMYEEKDLERKGCKEMVQDPGGDEEIRTMAREEMKAAESCMVELEERIRVLLLPSDPIDERNVMLEIRAGTGGSEANIFAGDLFDIYRKFASTEGWKVKVIEESQGDDGGFKSVTMEINGERVYSKLKWEAGVHRVQRVPATESAGRVHTSTATVAIMPETDEVDVVLDMTEITMSTMRSGGAGGQNVNKVETAIGERRAFLFVFCFVFGVIRGGRAV